jgi:two-component system sensor histidine kinase PhoQ
MRAGRSLGVRLLLAATVVLAGFMGATGISLERAFRLSIASAIEQRLLAQVYGLLGAAEADEQGQLEFPAQLADPRFGAAGSGLYAEVRGPSGTFWRSSSALGIDIRAESPSVPGTPRFSDAGGPDSLFVLSFLVLWESEIGTITAYEVRVAESRQAFRRQLSTYRRTLWGWLAGAGIVLLGVQLLVLRWGLRPLSRFVAEVQAIEQGKRDRIEGPAPTELEPLARALNGLIDQGRRHLERHRNALGNLAHSLKTPLAVLRGAADADGKELYATVETQVERMDRTIAYQLQRAASAGYRLAPPEPVAPIAARVRDALLKVYAAKTLTLMIEIPAPTVFRGDPGDLMEILGNLGDNACKWARSRVAIRAENDESGINIVVEDDGPGIPPALATTLTHRGTRFDVTVEGQGIGLSVVREIVEQVYGGSIEIRPGALGGTALIVDLPA